MQNRIILVYFASSRIHAGTDTSPPRDGIYGSLKWAGSLGSVPFKEPFKRRRPTFCYFYSLTFQTSNWLQYWYFYLSKEIEYFSHHCSLERNGSLLWTESYRSFQRAVQKTLFVRERPTHSLRVKQTLKQKQNGLHWPTQTHGNNLGALHEKI